MNKVRLESYHLYGEKKRRWPLYVLVAAALCLLAGSTGWYWFKQRKPAPKEHPVAAQPVVESPKPVSLEGRYLFSGTIVLARAVERAALSGGAYDYNQPFSKLDTFEPAKYDGWLADMECPVTTNTVSYEQQVANLVFNCRPEWLPAMTKYIKFLNLANNHTYDMGANGFIETQKHLDEAGIQIVGNYRPTVKEDNCEVMSLPVRLKLSDNSETKAALPIAICAFHYFSFKPSPGELEMIERYAKIMPVFGLMHAGVEYLPTAGANQVSIARRMIDLGSEFVIGNSPHWVQNSEAYKGKLIAYSTGNFIFDQIDEETQRGLSIDATFQTEYSDNLAKWLELGPKCATRRDTCLEQAEQLGLSKIKLKLSYNPVASLGGSRPPRVTARADSALQKAVEERLNWVETLKGLTNN